MVWDVIVNTIRHIPPENGKLPYAMASVTVNNHFTIGCIRAAVGKDGCIEVNMPRRRNGLEGPFEPIVILNDPDLLKTVRHAVIDEYRRTRPDPEEERQPDEHAWRQSRW